MDEREVQQLKRLGRILVELDHEARPQTSSSDDIERTEKQPKLASYGRGPCPQGCELDPITGQCKCYASRGRNHIASGDWYTVERGPAPQQRIRRTGWRPGVPDLRDFSPDVRHLSALRDKRADHLASALESYRSARKAPSRLPKKSDLRRYCAEIEDQGDIGSCTAHAVVGLVEYYARRKGDDEFHGSRLFVYKVARRIAGLVGDSGAFIRSALGAAVVCGVPPERYWPYTDDEDAFDYDPDNFVYAAAANFQALSYFRYDPAGHMPKDRETLLRELKAGLRDELPFAFGFYGFPSFDHADVVEGDIPLPSHSEEAAWGHAVMAVGYDDDKEIAHPVTSDVSKGAFLIRNSWGRDWGDGGYGWLPYDYVRFYLASDFWSLVDMEWMEMQSFN